MWGRYRCSWRNGTRACMCDSAARGLTEALFCAQPPPLFPEHVALADQFVEVPGGTNNNNYANVKLIVHIAERARVDAVWPGW